MDLDSDGQITVKDAQQVAVIYFGGGQSPGICGQAVEISCGPGQLIGDANDDGRVTPMDSLIITNVYQGRMQAPDDICCLDANMDGQVSPADVQLTTQMFFDGIPSPGYCDMNLRCSIGQLIGDANDDGRITPGDARIISDIVFGRYQ